MKQLKLFPKIFLYTLALMLLITILASAMIYLLAPIISDEVRWESGNDASNGAVMVEDVPGIAPASTPRHMIITNAVLGSLPYSITICLVVSLVCAFFFSRAITKPIKSMLDTTTHMAVLEKNAACAVRSNDEIGMLSKGINSLYEKLLSTIWHLEQEKERVSEAEKQKVDFLRAASHELKTPVTALGSMLDNMIMGIGKYQDHSAYLPLCKEQADQLGKMISEVLDASRMGADSTNEEPQTFDVATFLAELCSQYRMIAGAHGQIFNVDLPNRFVATLPPKMFAKALSNILSNALAYTDPGKTIAVYMKDRNLVVENECEPIPKEHLNHIFEPFYRPDYARNREDGGNGLGLYIVASIFDKLNLSYFFCPMDEPMGMQFRITL